MSEDGKSYGLYEMAFMKKEEITEGKKLWKMSIKTWEIARNVISRFSAMIEFVYCTQL